MTNSRTGKVEYVYVDLRAVYPNDDDPNEEMSFEEIRAQSRGWLKMDWTAEKRKIPSHDLIGSESSQQASSPLYVENVQHQIEPLMEHAKDVSERAASASNNNTESIFRETKVERPKKMKIMEVKSETQTSMTFIIGSVEAC